MSSYNVAMILVGLCTFMTTVSKACTDTRVFMEMGSNFDNNIDNHEKKNEWVFSARTMDDTPMYLATLEVVPRGRKFISEAPPAGAKVGHQWMNRYGFIGATWSAETPGVYDDGMNEHGLSVAQNQLDETEYPPVSHM